MKMFDILVDVGEELLIVIFAVFAWTTSLSFLKVHSSSYWLICILTTIFIILQAVKLYRKYFSPDKRTDI
jgi:hypothetical protein